MMNTRRFAALLIAGFAAIGCAALPVATPTLPPTTVTTTGAFIFAELQSLDTPSDLPL